MTRSALLALSLGCVLGFVARAQDAPADGQALLQDASAYDDALEGWHGLGVYMAGAKNLGTTTIEVRRAEAPATYAVTTRQRFTLGGEPRSNTEELLLDTRLALLSSRSVEERVEAGKQVRKTTTLRREGDEWVREEVTDEGAPTSKRLPLTGPLYTDLPVLILFLRKADLSSPGEWRLQGARWGPRPQVEEIRLRVPAGRTKVVHRGREVEVTQVSVERVGRDVTTFDVDADGRVLSLAPEDAPVSMVSGTADEIEADLPAALPAVEPGVESPERCVRVYMEVLAKLRDGDEIDTVVDWPAVADDLAAHDPRMADLGVAGLRAALLQSAGRRPIDRAQLEAALSTVKVTMDGDDLARAAIPGREDRPFVLRRGERGWRIVGVPR